MPCGQFLHTTVSPPPHVRRVTCALSFLTAKRMNKGTPNGITPCNTATSPELLDCPHSKANDLESQWEGGTVRVRDSRAYS